MNTTFNILDKKNMLQVKRISPDATIPVRGSKYSAGLDLSSAEDCVVPSRGKYVVRTDLMIAIPLGTYGRIAPRSGLAIKHFIDVGAGVIDSDYRGAVNVVLFNHSKKDFEIAKGDRIAQLILERFLLPTIVETDSLDETVRGSDGFGSTGVSKK